MSWQIDPKTGDYVMTNGKPVDDKSLVYPAYYRITIGRGRWLHAPDTNYGSDLNTLKKRNDSSAYNMMQRAVQPIIDDGRASDIVITASPVPNGLRGNAQIGVAITDAQGEVQTLNLPPVGD